MVAHPDHGAGNDPEPFFFRGVGSLSQPRLNIFTVGNMRVMICLGKGGLRSLSASSFFVGWGGSSPPPPPTSQHSHRTKMCIHICKILDTPLLYPKALENDLMRFLSKCHHVVRTTEKKQWILRKFLKNEYFILEIVQNRNTVRYLVRKVDSQLRLVRRI